MNRTHCVYNNTQNAIAPNQISRPDAGPPSYPNRIP
jgi:hypothetical protein